MTSNQVLQRNVDAQRQRSRRQLENLQERTQGRAHLAEDRRRDAYEAEGKLQEIQDNNPQFNDVSIARAVAYGGITLLILCAYLFDIVLFYPTGRFVAEETFGDNAPLVFATSLVIPALVLTAEISVASHRHLAREERRWGAYWGSTLIALIMLVVMPAMVISTHPYMRHLDVESVEGAMLRWQAVSFVALVIVTHGLILFGGSAGHQAKAYAAFALRRRGLRRKVQRAEREYAAESRAAAADFMNYRRLLESLNQNGAERVEAGAFDESTRRVLREHFGCEVIVNAAAPEGRPAPDSPVMHHATLGSNNGNGHHHGDNHTPPPSPTGNGRPPRPEPPFTPSGGDEASPLPQAPAQVPTEQAVRDDEANNMEDYYRRILSRRQSEEESEVRA